MAWALEVLSFATLAFVTFSEKNDVLSLRFYSKSGDHWGFCRSGSSEQTHSCDLAKAMLAPLP
jgi:hypothetical protein